MRRKRVAQRMAGGGLLNTGRQHGATHHLLNQAGVEMMTPLGTRSSVTPTAMLREQPLPTPFHRSTGILPSQRMWQLNAAQAAREILLVYPTDILKMKRQLLGHRLR